MKTINTLLYLLLILNYSLLAQTLPKREFRGTWVASVYNLDWPKTRGTGQHTVQKNELITLLDTLKRTGMNAVILQIRPNCDALYSSSYEPWSYWLTGTEGTAPNPYWDPLAFAVEETHKRGMELHAWINPYRVKEGANTAVHTSHIINQQPSWILTVGGDQKKILNPGLAVVRTYLVNVILDIINNYDIDGIHFDDYFYPYSPNTITTEDAQTFADFPRGFTDIGKWRRDNVNLLIEGVYNAIALSSKPYVKFGISPFGIWKSGTPSGITGTSAYSSLYCDAIAWLQNGTVDYLMPQLYWKIGGSQDYDKLMKWWADSVAANNRLFYPGQQFTDTYDNNELPLQFKLNRASTKVKGNALFRASRFVTNMFGFKDSLINNYYMNKAIVPSLNLKNAIAPNQPVNLTASGTVSGVMLSWTAPSAAADGDLPRYYAIYRSNSSNIDITLSQNLKEIVYSNVTSYLDAGALSESSYYAVTSIDPYRNESIKSNEVTLQSVTVLENFESGVGKFNRQPTFSGSTTGISTLSGAAHTTANFFTGSGGLEVTLLDNASSSNDWFVRLLSGSGLPANNVLLASTGYLGYWMKTGNAPTGAEVSIAIREGGNSGATLERGVKRAVINDNNWHLYQWNLSNAGDWEAFTGNGTIDSSTFTLDAVLFFAPNNSPDWTLYIDDVTHDLLTPLPVELSNFTAKVFANSIILTWRTESEIGNYGFVIERFTKTLADNQIINNKENWVSIGFIEGAGNSNSAREYNYTDKNLVNGTYKYRLKQIDNDGSFGYSDVLTVDVNHLNEYRLSQNFPNPFNSVTTINYQIPEKNRVTLKVYSIIGAEVATLVDDVKENGNYSVVFDATELSSGVYFYTIRSGSFSQTKKFVVLK